MLKSYYSEAFMEAGCDEAGRGCLAGPVFAAAVILPADCRIDGLDDSKKLSAKKREELRPVIEACAISFGVARVDPSTIDEINILRASILAMHLALDELQPGPRQIIVDGNKFLTYNNLPHHCIIKGDSRYLSIAAASILAKTYRDAYMKQIHMEYPDYQWQQNKGYPTLSHRLAIQNKGISKYHRKSFRITNVQLELNFRK